MMAGEEGPGQVVEAPGAGLTEIALPGRLGLVVALPDDLAGVAAGATDPLRPPQVAEDLEATCVVDQGLNVEHPWSERILADGRNRRSSAMPIVSNCTRIPSQVQVAP